MLNIEGSRLPFFRRGLTNAVFRVFGKMPDNLCSHHAEGVAIGDISIGSNSSCTLMSPLIHYRGAIKCEFYNHDVNTDSLAARGKLDGEIKNWFKRDVSQVLSFLVAQVLIGLNMSQHWQLLLFFLVSFFLWLFLFFSPTVCLVELSCVFTISSQSVKLGLVSLCPPDWHRRVCDRPERHPSPIRSTTLINCLKKLGWESGEKLSVPLKKPLKGNREGN